MWQFVSVLASVVLSRPARMAAVALLAALACSGNADAAANQAPQGNDVAAQIAQRIEIRENRTVFAVSAMLNAGGYDEEALADAGGRPEMHTVRRSLRAALARRLADSVFLRADNYYKAHAAATDIAAYVAVALSTSGPPSFTPGPTWPTAVVPNASLRSLQDLPALLRTFSRAFPLDSVYDSHQLTIRAYLVEITAALRRNVAAALRYARVQSATELSGFGASGHLVVIPDLLLSHGRTFSFVLGDTFYSIDGPQSAATYSPREFIRAITKSVSFDSLRFAAALNKARPAYLAVRELPAMTGFRTLETFVDENLVRAILSRYTPPRDHAAEAMAAARIAADAKAGFVLVPYFVEQLKTYEAQADPLHQYYPKLFEQLDAAREAVRWRDSVVR